MRSRNYWVIGLLDHSAVQTILKQPHFNAIRQPNRLLPVIYHLKANRKKAH